MIPQRVKLKGFLCYQDEQEVAFDGASLWMLAGMNGSGKSSVFDAVTYALFGHHRGGGSMTAVELINKSSDRLAVEFEFTLDGQPYLIRRTIQRSTRGSPKSTLQIYRNGSGAGWEAIEGTHQKKEFDNWVRDNIGLNYETFTSSVLLLQGNAEKLLNSGPKDRFGVLAGVVDLERYERLHKRADEQRKMKDDEVKRLRIQLDTLTDVTAETLAEADTRIAAAEAERERAQAEVERLQALEHQAKLWTELQGRLATARQRWQQAERLIGDAAAIERDAARLHELQTVLPRVQTVVEQRGQIRTSEAKTKELTDHKQKLESQLGQHDHALEQARRKRGSLDDLIRGEEQRHRAVATKLRQAATLLERLKEYERQQDDQTRLQGELARLPADPAEAVRAARAENERLSALAAVVPLLDRLHRQRDELRQSRTREAASAQALQTIQAKGEQLAVVVEQLKPQTAEAARVRRDADEEHTRVRTLLEQARDQFNELSDLEGAKICRHCGQKLTPEHVRDEKKRRAAEVAETEKKYQQTANVRKAALVREQELAGRLEEQQKALQEARGDYREQKQQAEQARKDVERLQRECGQGYGELPESFRLRVHPTPPADWLDTTYPAVEDVASIRREVSGHLLIQRRLREAEEVESQWRSLRGREEAVRQNLARVRADLPADPPAVRKDHVRLEEDERALDRSLQARKADCADTQQLLDRLGREREQTQNDLTKTLGLLKTEETSRQHCQHTLNRTLKELPAAWLALVEKAGSRDVYDWHTERDRLLQQGTAERATQLQQARLGVQMLEQEKTSLEQQQDALPLEARQEPATVQGQLREAKAAQRGRDDELGQARQHRASLEQKRQQRSQWEKDVMQAEKEQAHARLLADLLSRDRLQLHLVRQAERQVVDHANAVLDRLSGGQMFLRLSGEAGGEGTGSRALELEVFNRATGERPINVAFLSGSQKFRVAVCLALGIGQYASRQHRPIESVIIDEGFGCLDKESRPAMIQELQNLRSQLRCILLVSHQEEFADAFADGYRFELAQGATRVTRFQR